MSLISLIYISFASHSMNDDELKAILETARDFNGKNDITGMLLFRDDFFIQVLEGKAEVVEPLFTKIEKDARHQNVLVIETSNVEARSFPNWSMGFNKIGDEDVETLPGFNDFLQNDRDVSFFMTQPSRAAELLARFKSHVFF
jgi:hypothetical protein